MVVPKSFTNACHSCQNGMWLQCTYRAVCLQLQRNAISDASGVQLYYTWSDQPGPEVTPNGGAGSVYGLATPLAAGVHLEPPRSVPWFLALALITDEPFNERSPGTSCPLLGPIARNTGRNGPAAVNTIEYTLMQVFRSHSVNPFC